jgi:hypothetical protein
MFLLCMFWGCVKRRGRRSNSIIISVVYGIIRRGYLIGVQNKHSDGMEGSSGLC